MNTFANHAGAVLAIAALRKAVRAASLTPKIGLIRQDLRHRQVSSVAGDDDSDLTNLHGCSSALDAGHELAETHSTME